MGYQVVGQRPIDTKITWVAYRDDNRDPINLSIDPDDDNRAFDSVIADQ